MKELYIKMPEGEDRVFREGECGTFFKTIKSIKKKTNDYFIIEYENMTEIIFAKNTPVVFIISIKNEKTEELECASAEK